MKTLKILLFYIILMPITSSASYTAKERVDYLHKSFKALKNAPAKIIKNTQNFLEATNNNQCQSDVYGLRVNCLMEAARKNCIGRKSRKGRKKCGIYSDVVTVNELSEKNFIALRDRYKIMRKHKDYKAQLHLEVRSKYASMTMDFCLQNKELCLNNSRDKLISKLDNYCLKKADRLGLSWQHCAAAILIVLAGHG